MKRLVIRLLFKDVLGSPIAKSYDDYLNNKLDWESRGSADLTNRAGLPEGYEEWSDSVWFNPNPFMAMRTHVYAYWIFKTNPDPDFDTGNYPWTDVDHFEFYGRNFNTLKEVFEYIMKLYAEGNDL